jgi:hypothetical protein
LEGKGDKQPINNFVVRKAEDELVDHAVDANGPAHELELSVLGVVEYEMVTIEVCECFSADAACHL